MENSNLVWSNYTDTIDTANQKLCLKTALSNNHTAEEAEGCVGRKLCKICPFSAEERNDRN